MFKGESGKKSKLFHFYLWVTPLSSICNHYNVPVTLVWSYLPTMVSTPLIYMGVIFPINFSSLAQIFLFDSVSTDTKYILVSNATFYLEYILLDKIRKKLSSAMVNFKK